MAYYFLSETLGAFELVSLLFAFLAVILVIVGYKEDDSEKDLIKTAFPYICLGLSPVLQAGGAIAMRVMRKMPEAVISTYVSLTLFVVSGVLVACIETEGQTYKGFSFFKDFNLLSWVLVPLNGVSTVIVQTSKFAAYKRQEPSKLQIYSFLPRV